MKLAIWEQLATQGIPRWQVHKRVAGGSQRKGRVASPVRFGADQDGGSQHSVDCCGIRRVNQTKNFAGSFVFSKSQRKWERLSAREKNGKEKNGKEKNAVAWFVGFHVAAVRAVVIQSVADEENVDHGGVLSAFSD